MANAAARSSLSSSHHAVERVGAITASATVIAADGAGVESQASGVEDPATAAARAPRVSLQPTSVSVTTLAGVVVVNCAEIQRHGASVKDATAASPVTAWTHGC